MKRFVLTVVVLSIGLVPGAHAQYDTQSRSLHQRNLTNIQRSEPISRNVQPLTQEQRQMAIQPLNNNEKQQLREYQSQGWKPLSDQDKRQRLNNLKQMEVR